MSLTCPECSVPFRVGDALCDDWRDPARSFGCPHCGAFLTTLPGPARVKLRSGILVGVVAVPAFMLLGRGLVLGDGPVLLLSGLATIGALTLLASDLWGASRRLVRTGHRRPPGQASGSSAAPE